MANGLLTGGNNEGHDTTTTHSAVSDGTLIVRDPGQQTQLIGEIGNQVADITRTEGQISAINAGKAELPKKGITEPEKGASKEAWERYNAQLAATDGYKTALAGGAAPYVAEVIGHYSNLDDAGKVAAHAVVNAALAAAQNQNALAGAAGAATAEIVGIIATQMYGKTVSELDETQKQTVSTLATLAAGLAGGFVSIPVNRTMHF